ncbi:MAG: LacI family transcriptional regulator [Spirochaetaceae bacterium 4572_59]|nr:MAG: LacI family transcriptional regulator [Spirochaetaceae bacterium 4572_59]
MKGMKVFLMGLFLAVLCLSGAFANGQQEKSDDTITVGLSNNGAESGWQLAYYNSVHEEAAARGWKLNYVEAQNKQENQIQALRSFIAMDVDAIVLQPVVETGWEPVLKEAKQAGIPVILSGRGIKVSDEDLYVTLICSDFITEGEMAGEWLADQTNGKASIVELQGTAGASAANDRKKGFENIINTYPEMKIIKSQVAEFTRTKGKEVMEAFIKAEGDSITAVYAHNDDMGLGAIQALEEAGMKPGEDVIVISIDGIKDAFTAMVDGTLNATVECTPLLGPKIYDAVQSTLNGETLPKFMPSDDRLFDTTTAAKELPNRKF